MPQLLVSKKIWAELRFELALRDMPHAEWSDWTNPWCRVAMLSLGDNCWTGEVLSGRLQSFAALVEGWVRLLRSTADTALCR